MEGVSIGMCLNHILQKDERELKEKEIFYVKGDCLVILLVLLALGRHYGSNKHVGNHPLLGISSNASMDPSKCNIYILQRHTC